MAALAEWQGTIRARPKGWESRCEWGPTDEGVRGARREGDGKWVYTAVRAARRAPKSLGAWEYLIQWKGGGRRTWEYESNLLTNGRATGGLKRDLEEARLKARVPSSMHECLHERTADSKCSNAQWARRQRLAQACTQAQPSDTDMQDLWAELVQHADQVHGGTWRVGSEIERTAAESGRDDKRWARNQSGPACTSYPGEKETIKEQNADGKGESETVRTTIGLEPDAAWKQAQHDDDGVSLEQDEHEALRQQDADAQVIIAHATR